jgi:PhnB protein
VFGAVQLQRWTAADGRIDHAELELAGQRLYLADAHPEIGVRGPRALGGTAVSFVLSVAGADTTVALAVDAGATLERPVTMQKFGARAGWIVDPFGHRWNVQPRSSRCPWSGSANESATNTPLPASSSHRQIRIVTCTETSGPLPHRTGYEHAGAET